MQFQFQYFRAMFLEEGIRVMFFWQGADFGINLFCQEDWNCSNGCFYACGIAIEEDYYLLGVSFQGPNLGFG